MEHAAKSPSDQQRGGGPARQHAAGPSAAATLVDNRPAAVAQRELAAAVGDSPRLLAQQASLRVALSSRVTAQGRRLEGLFGDALQRRSDPAHVSARLGVAADAHKRGADRVAEQVVRVQPVLHTTPPVQRYVDPSVLVDIIADVDIKQKLTKSVAKYNLADVAPAQGYYAETLVSERTLQTQLARLDKIERYIDERSPQAHPHTVTVLQVVKRNIAAEREYLKDQQQVFTFCEEHKLPPRRVFLIFQEPGGRKVLNESMAATQSDKVLRILKLLVQSSETSPSVVVKLLPLILENVSLRVFMANLNADDDRFDAERLEQFVENYERLVDWYRFLIETRKLPEEGFTALLDDTISQLFQGTFDYQAAAGTLAMQLPKPVTILEIGSELTEGMAKLGYQLFLAGGGAIFFRGGKRPVADLDFRMDPQPGLTSFSTFHGKQVLLMVNRLLEISKATRAGLTFSYFSGAGKKAITIGTHNWFKVEVSISINQAFAHGAPESKDFRFHSEEYLKHVEPKAKPTKSLRLLSLIDLLRDKLKTAISRTKEAEVNHKKVAQDLFDILSLITLLRDQGVDVLNRKDLEAHLKERVDQYKVQNLEPPEVNIADFPVDDVVKLMLYRLVMTAQYHLQEGPRRDILLRLQSHSSMEVLDVLDQLAGVPVGDLVKAFGEFDIGGWFETWSKIGATPEEHMKIPAPNLQIAGLNAPVLAPNVFPGDALVARILETAPPALLQDEDHVLILYILYKSTDGLRFLANSSNAVEVMAAFSPAISVRSFSLFYKEYCWVDEKKVDQKKVDQKRKVAEKPEKKFAKGNSRGLQLLDAGRNYIVDKIKSYPTS